MCPIFPRFHQRLWHSETLQANNKSRDREIEVVSKRCDKWKKNNEMTWGNDDLRPYIDITLAVSHFSKVPLNEVAPENTASQQQTEREREREREREK